MLGIAIAQHRFDNGKIRLVIDRTVLVCWVAHILLQIKGASGHLFRRIQLGALNLTGAPSASDIALAKRRRRFSNTCRSG